MKAEIRVGEGESKGGVIYAYLYLIWSYYTLCAMLRRCIHDVVPMYPRCVPDVVFLGSQGYSAVLSSFYRNNKNKVNK